MTSVVWVFNFVSDWLFKSFRIKEPPVLGFLGAKESKNHMVHERSDKKPTTLWAVI
jgi:hypothetical protein